MTTFFLVGKSITLPAIQIAQRAATRDKTAWMSGQYVTIQLITPIEALRVHTNNKNFPGRPAAREQGAWVLIGDVIQTAGQIADTRSLPTNNVQSMVAFTHVSEAYLGINTVLNIGLASPKFAGKGGEFQGEFISGPDIIFKPLTKNIWHSRHANA